VRAPSRAIMIESRFAAYARCYAPLGPVGAGLSDSPYRESSRPVSNGSQRVRGNRSHHLLVAVSGLLALLCPAAAIAAGRPLRDIAFERTPARIERGRYLAEGVLQCILCHSERDWRAPGAPPIEGRKGGGIVWYEKAWLIAPNITPDRETGAGAWTDDMLARAIREGISRDGRVLDREFAWYDTFRFLSDEDVASVVVYLRTIPPVSNSLPKTRRPPGLPEPEARAPLTAPVPGPRSPAPVDRGRYLATIAGCYACHTSWYGSSNPGYFGGGNLITRGPFKAFSANITFDASGIPYYDEALFLGVMRTGRVVARELSPTMPWIAFRRMSDNDLRAIFAFLGSQRYVRHNVSNLETPTHCPACGQKHGFGDRNPSKRTLDLPVAPEALAALAGEYRFDDGYLMRVMREGNSLTVEEKGKKQRLYSLGDGRFTADTWPDAIRFEHDPGGRVTGLIAEGLNEDRARKVR